MDQHTVLFIIRCLKNVYSKNFWEFPGGPVVRTPVLPVPGRGLIPGWGTKIREAWVAGSLFIYIFFKIFFLTWTIFKAFIEFVIMLFLFYV